MKSGQSSPPSRSLSPVACEIEKDTQCMKKESSIPFSRQSTQSTELDTADNRDSCEQSLLIVPSAVPLKLDLSDSAHESPRGSTSTSSFTSGDGKTNGMCPNVHTSYSRSDLLLARTHMTGEKLDIGVFCKDIRSIFVPEVTTKVGKFVRRGTSLPPTRCTPRSSDLSVVSQNSCTEEDDASLVERVLDVLADDDCVESNRFKSNAAAMMTNTAGIWNCSLLNLYYLDLASSHKSHMMALDAAVHCARRLKHEPGQLESNCSHSDQQLIAKKVNETPTHCLPAVVEEEFVRRAKLARQVEYYFSNCNLAQDSFLWSLMEPDGWVATSSIVAFPRLQCLGATEDTLIEALVSSQKVEISWDGRAIRSRFHMEPLARTAFQKADQEQPITNPGPSKLSAKASPWIPSREVAFPVLGDTSVAVSTAGSKCLDKESTHVQRTGKARRRGTKLKIATHLHHVESKDAACIFLAYRIHRLGFGSAAILRKHYEQYGPVDEVLLSNDEEQTTDANFATRIRPSGIAIIVMLHPEAAAAAIAAGENQEVSGELIRIRKFERRSCTQLSSENSGE